MSFLIHLCNKISKKSPLWSSKVKKQGRKVTKHLPFEEAFMTHHIFFPQKVVVLHETSILLPKKMTFFEKLPQLYSYETSCFVWVIIRTFMTFNLDFKMAFLFDFWTFICSLSSGFWRYQKVHIPIMTKTTWLKRKTWIVMLD